MRQPSNHKKRALIFANGTQIDLPAVAAMIAPDDVLIAADGGLRFLDALERAPDVLIGDMDSIDSSRLEALRAAGTRIEQVPAHKDETDLELAVAAALSQDCDEVLIVGALGGRLDMTLANIFLLLQMGPGVDARLEDGLEEVFLIHGDAQGAERVIDGRAGERVSLLALGGPAAGITTSGLEYPLRGETLYPDRARGVSNVMQGERAGIRLQSGTLICIHTRKTD